MTKEELKAIREEKKMDKGEFAKLLGITPMVYGRYESGTLAISEKIETAVKELVSKVSDAAVATEIEVKKNTRAAGRKAKEAIEAVVTSDETVATEIEVKKKTRAATRKAKETAKEAVEAVVTSDEAVATEVEVKKKTRAAARKAKEAVDDLVQEATKKTTIFIQSQLNGIITPEEVLDRIPEGCDEVYIKPEENKAYWVKGEDSGSISLW